MSAFDKSDVTSPRSLSGVLRSEFHSLTFTKQLENRSSHRASMKEVFDASLVANEAKAFVDDFFDELLGKVYKDNRSRLLTDEKFIRSAFLFHIREQIAKASDARKEREEAKTQ